MSVTKVKKANDAIDPILIKDGVVKDVEEYNQLMDALVEKLKKFKESQASHKPAKKVGMGIKSRTAEHKKIGKKNRSKHSE